MNTTRREVLAGVVGLGAAMLGATAAGVASEKKRGTVSFLKSKFTKDGLYVIDEYEVAFDPDRENYYEVLQRARDGGLIPRDAGGFAFARIDKRRAAVKSDGSWVLLEA